MKLIDACALARSCGLTETGEAVLNIQMHANSLFDYDKIGVELYELELEYAAAGNMMIHNYEATLLKEETKLGFALCEQACRIARGNHTFALAFAQIRSQDYTVPIRQLATRIKARYQELMEQQEREQSC